MKRMLLALMLCASSANAQPTQAQFDSLKAAYDARISALELILGSKFNYPRPTESIAADLVPANELPTGQYPYILSDYQIRRGLAEIYSGLQAQVTGALQRVAALEGNSSNNPLTVVAGDLTVSGTLKLGDAACMPDAMAQIKICDNDGVSLHVETNADGSQYQNSSKHVSGIHFGDDAGVRIMQNGYISSVGVPMVDPSNGVTFMNHVRDMVNPSLPYGLFGPDSQAQWSWLMKKPGTAHEYTQDLVLRTYEDQKVLSFESFRAGWTFKFATSTGVRTIDKWYVLPPQQ